MDLPFCFAVTSSLKEAMKEDLKQKKPLIGAAFYRK